MRVTIHVGGPRRGQVRTSVEESWLLCCRATLCPHVAIRRYLQPLRQRFFSRQKTRGRRHPILASPDSSRPIVDGFPFTSPPSTCFLLIRGETSSTLRRLIGYSTFSCACSLPCQRFSCTSSPPTMRSVEFLVGSSPTLQCPLW